MKIYVASSYRAPLYDSVVQRLRVEGFEVYDWKRPHGNPGVRFSPEMTTLDEYAEDLENEAFKDHFKSNKAAIDDADIVILVQPCGASANFEFGYGTRAGAATAVLLSGDQRRDLMYGDAALFDSFDELIAWARAVRENG